MSDWHHVVLNVDSSKSEFWVDGVLAESLEYSTGSGARRAFFSDVENIDFMAIGNFKTNEANASNSFYGGMDDFNVYARSLTQDEITFLYELRKGREQIPRLDSVVDSIGTMEMVQSGQGYKESPEVVFSYGADANETAQLTAYDSSATQAHGPMG